MIIPPFIQPSLILPLILPFLCCGANVYNKSKPHKDRPCLTQPSRSLIASSWPVMFTNHSWRFLGPSSKAFRILAPVPSANASRLFLYGA